MKVLISSLCLTAVAMPAIGATTSTKNVKKKRSSVGVSFFADMNTVRDSRTNETSGIGSTWGADVTKRLDKNNSLRAGLSYKYRTFKDKDVESLNRDGLGELQVRHLYKGLTYKNTGIADFRIQTRYAHNMDSFFKKYYANTGYVDVTAYFGRKFGKWSINKYVSNFKVTKYIANEHVSTGSYDSKYSFRIAPSYKFTKKFEGTFSVSYDNVTRVDSDSREELDYSFSGRYVVGGGYAFLARLDVPWLKTTGNNSLELEKDAYQNLGYVLTFSKYFN